MVRFIHHKIVLVIFLLFIFVNTASAGENGWISAQSGLSLRDRPAKTGKRLAIIPYNQKVVIINTDDRIEEINGLKGSWYNIVWKNKTGWVFGGYVSRIRNHTANTLFYAARFGDYKKALSAVNTQLNINTVNNKNQNALHIACIYYRYNTFNIIDLLLKQKIHINHKDRYGNTPLHYLIGTYTRSKRVIRYIDLLIAHGADLAIKNKNGETPFHYAVQSGSYLVVEYLLKHSDINSRTKDGRTPLHYACFRGRSPGPESELLKIAELLLKNDVKTQITTKRKYTTYSYNEGEKPQVYKVYPENSTPYDYARITNWKELLQLLKKHGVEK